MTPQLPWSSPALNEGELEDFWYIKKDRGELQMKDLKINKNYTILCGALLFIASNPFLFKKMAKRSKFQR